MRCTDLLLKAPDRPVPSSNPLPQPEDLVLMVLLLQISQENNLQALVPERYAHSPPPLHYPHDLKFYPTGIYKTAAM